MKQQINCKRQIILDTETTGINKSIPHYKNHRIIEIGAIEIINRNITGKKFHTYINPKRPIDYQAFRIHGINNTFLNNKPTFKQIKNDFFKFIKNSEIIIHNAPFDIGFINYELFLMKENIKIENTNFIIDSLSIARKIFPGKKNSIDALCERYNINKQKRHLHGALLDAEILATIFLLMTRKQKKIFFIPNYKNKTINNSKYKIKNIKKINKNPPTKIILSDNKENNEHKKIIKKIEQKSKNCIWIKKS